MNLIVTSDPESIAAAIELARRTEQAMVEEAFAEILACNVTGPHSLHPWIYRSHYLDEGFRRHREMTLPRLQAIAEGRGGESEPVRIYAAVVLGNVDPDVGFRSLLNLLKSDDPVTLSEALNQLAWIQIEATECGLIMPI